MIVGDQKPRGVPSKNTSRLIVFNSTMSTTGEKFPGEQGRESVTGDEVRWWFRNETD
jgi:hypothetical protein